MPLVDAGNWTFCIPAAARADVLKFVSFSPHTYFPPRRESNCQATQRRGAGEVGIRRSRAPNYGIASTNKRVFTGPEASEVMTARGPQT